MNPLFFLLEMLDHTIPTILGRVAQKAGNNRAPASNDLRTILDRERIADPISDGTAHQVTGATILPTEIADI